MKTIKFRLIEHIKQRGYTSESLYCIQLKSLFGWKDYTFDNGGLTEVKEFDSRKDCLNELFKTSGRAPSHIKLQEFPVVRIIKTEKIPS